jgi:predicted phosphodiesterase
MTTRDLGEIIAPLLVCGGAYGNLTALKALEQLQASLGITDDHVIHTGDAVAYCADTESATQFIASRGWHAIKGNVEEQIASGAADCGCGFEEGSVCDAASQRWYGHAVATLSGASRAWMSALPAQLTFTMAGLNVRVVHGSFAQTNRFMFASLPDDEFAAELDAAEADLVIAGHTGIPFTKILGERCWHNSGALGMPANDATQRVWVSVLYPHDGGITLTHHALEYELQETADEIRAEALPEVYADALVSGFWPSLDILPDAERKMAGKPLMLDGASFSIRRQAERAAQ